MKGVVIDASITAAWVLDDEQSETGEWVLDQMQAGARICAPTLWLLEITNLLFNAERRGRIDKNHRDTALNEIEKLPVVIAAAPTLVDLRLLRTYAERHQLTAYDAEYLRVAKELNLHLATLDKNLIAAAMREKIPVAQK